ncbi:MAG: ThiF family adenylyltransferase [Coriobacteriia bacterium]|nr:ThiF family adenylyltransferase [Coriobacteriia bacterium]
MVTGNSTTGGELGRYASQALINGWDQERLSAARVLVIGYGVLGDPICRTLVTLGIGTLAIADFDVIEERNLGKQPSLAAGWDGTGGVPKVEVGCQELARINPSVRLEPLCVDIVTGFGAACYAEYDVVVLAADNYTARHWPHRYATLMGVPVVECGTEGLYGQVTVTWPDDADAACFACWGNPRERLARDVRKSCQGLYLDEHGAKIPMLVAPATATAGLACLEVLKCIFAREEGSAFPKPAAGMQYLLDGFDVTRPVMGVRLTRRDDCEHHERLDATNALEYPLTDQTMISDVRTFVAGSAGCAPEDVALEVHWDVLHEWICPNCHAVATPRIAASRAGKLACTACGYVVSENALDTIPVILHPYLDDGDGLTLADYHLPERHVLKASAGDWQGYVVPTGTLALCGREVKAAEATPAMRDRLMSATDGT